MLLFTLKTTDYERGGGGVGGGVLFPVPSFYDTPFPVHKDNKKEFTIHRENKVLKICICKGNLRRGNILVLNLVQSVDLAYYIL